MASDPPYAYQVRTECGIIVHVQYMYNDMYNDMYGLYINVDIHVHVNSP